VKVAALYDVHGMPRALEAVLAEVDADVLLFGGDLIAGPFPQRTVALARAAGGRFIRGNCERVPSEWDREHLDPDVLRWLEELPLTASLDGVLYCHATPVDDTPITTELTPDDVLRETFGGLDERTVVIGHTHHQFDRTAGDVRVVNAGSVGMPYEGKVAAFWTLVEDGEPTFRRTAFDVERAAAEIRVSGWPGAGAFVAENLLAAPSRDEAVAFFEGRRAT
jgi:diadenosine tetraphosphatase ApaH/serine/threonine PP2A family protein phosphatase